VSRTAIDEWALGEYQRLAAEKRALRDERESALAAVRELLEEDLHEPDGDVLYALAGRAHCVETEFAAMSALKIGCADLGAEQPHVLWISEQSPALVDGLAVRTFRRHGRFNGFAHTASATVLLNTDLSPEQAARTAAHELHHLAHAPAVAAAVGNDLANRARSLLDRADRMLAGDPLADVACRAHEAAAAARVADPGYTGRQIRAFEKAEEMLEDAAAEYGERIGRVFDQASYALSRRTPTVHSFDFVTRIWPAAGMGPGDVAKTAKGLFLNTAGRSGQAIWVPV